MKQNFSNVDFGGHISLLKTQLGLASKDRPIFEQQDLSGVDFTKANLDGAIFEDCDLSGTVFSYAKLEGDSKFIRCKLFGTNFQGASLSPYSFIFNSNYREAIFDNPEEMVNSIEEARKIYQNYKQENSSQSLLGGINGDQDNVTPLYFEAIASKLPLYATNVPTSKVQKTTSLPSAASVLQRNTTAKDAQRS